MNVKKVICRWCAEQDHTRLWFIAAMTSMGMQMVSDTIKIVAMSAVLKIAEKFSDVGAEILHAIASQFE